MSEATSERIKRLVIPMVSERSREPGDPWDTVARELALIAAVDAHFLPTADSIAKALNPEAFDPPNHWTLGNVKAAQKTARDMAERVMALFQS